VTLPSDAEARALVQEILAQAKYAKWRVTGIGNSWVEWFFSELARVQRWFAELAATSPALFVFTLVGMGLLAGALLAHVVWSVRRALRDGAGDAPVDAGGARREAAETAAELAAQGRYLDAARLMQVAVLETLARRRAVPLSPAASNAVVIARLASATISPEFQERTAALMRRLERRWFRDRQEDAPLYEDWVRLHHDLAATAA
jgi:hypothetical protein